MTSIGVVALVYCLFLLGCAVYKILQPPKTNDWLPYGLKWKEKEKNEILQ